MTVRRGCNSGSLTQEGYLLADGCQEMRLQTGGPQTGHIPSAEPSPSNSSGTETRGRRERWREYLVGKQY